MGRPKGSKNKSISVVGDNKKESLFSTPRNVPTNYMPRFYNLGHEPEEIIQPSERLEGVQLGRELFAKMPLVSAAIMNKNRIAVGNAWQPDFVGVIRNEADKQWVEQAKNWLINDYYPNVNWQGQNFSFNESLVLTGKDIDVEGGSLMIYRTTKSGLPRIQFISVDRVGCRGSEQFVTGGSYDGYKIYDGVIYNNDGMPIAYKILGSTPEKDEYVSAFNCQYIFESDWATAGHGISRVSYSVTNLMDIQDINELLKITIKNYSKQGIIHSNGSGKAPKGKNIFAKETTPPTAAQQVAGQTQNKIFYDNSPNGGTTYISSLDGSEIKPFSFDRPSPNTEAFIFRIASESIASMGWFIELVCPQKLNGTSTRLIQDQARKLVIWRQQTLERRAKAILQYGLSVAMTLGLVPKTDNKTWMRWNFGKPGELTVDSGYDNAAQIESLKMGITTKAEVCARRGKDWKEVSNQSEIELRDLFNRAKAIAKEFNMTEAEAREWLSKRDINMGNTIQPTDNTEPPTDNTNNGEDGGTPAA